MTDYRQSRKLDDDARAMRDLWMAELWKPCRELSRGVRAEQREEVAERNLLLTSTESAPVTDVA